MQEGVFEGREAFVEALRSALLHACQQNCREIFCLDAGFAEWPWSDEEVLAALRAWVHPPRCLHLLALQYEDMREQHPRFVKWRTTWGHCVEARAYEPEATFGGKLDAALFTRGGETVISVRLFDTARWRGALSLQPLDAMRTHQWFDAVAQRSSAAFAATNLGL